jgi:hypothetical protein
VNTLQQLVAFTGVTGTAGQHVGASVRKASLRDIGSLVTLLTAADRNSMQAMAAALLRLPPISLSAELVGESSSQPPFAPVIRVQPSTGVVVETVVNYFQAGRPLPTNAAADGLVDGNEVRADGTVPSTTFDDPGPYVAVITRTGITNVGVTVLEKRIAFTVMFPPPPPAHSSQPAQPIPPQPANPSCGAAADLDAPVIQGITGIRIFGTGFQFAPPPPEYVDIYENDGVLASGQADGSGAYDIRLSVVDQRPPVEHTVYAQGRTSGRKSGPAGYRA